MMKNGEVEGMKIWRELLGYVKLIVIVVAITLGINNVVLINAKIPSPSMEKTLMVKDRLFGFRMELILICSVMKFLKSSRTRSDLIL